MKTLWKIVVLVGFMSVFASCSKDYNGPIDPITGKPQTHKGAEGEGQKLDESDSTEDITDGGEHSDYYGGSGKKKKKNP